jgi:type II secretory pathway pseudopilin PulG
MVVVVLMLGILAAIAVPSIHDIQSTIALGEAQRRVTNELQYARLLAVSSNRPIRVRFNCPSAGYYRTVELIGTPTVQDAADNAPTRCSPNLFPFPPADDTPLTRPNHDGPVRMLDPRTAFGAVQTIEFWPDGTAHYQDADANPVWAVIPPAGLALTVTKGAVVKTVTVNGLGKIQSQ